MTGRGSVAAAVAGLLVGVAVSANEVPDADERAAMGADVMSYGTTSGRLLETAVAFGEIVHETDTECGVMAIVSFAARSYAVGYQFMHLSLLRRLQATEDPELVAYAAPRHEALRGLMPGVLDRDLRWIEDYFETDESPGADVRGFREILNDLESTLRLAHDMMLEDGDPGTETKEPAAP